MKIIATVIALTLASSWSAFGKAYFYTRSELIKNAEVIAIVVLEEPEDAKPVGEARDPFVTDTASGKQWSYSQQANARVEKVIKGEIPDDFILYGKEGFICAQCELTKGRFLVFLKKDGGLWAGENWQLSLRPIQEKEVEWYVSEDQRFPMKLQNMDDVVALIQAELKKQQSELGVGESVTRPESKTEGR